MTFGPLLRRALFAFLLAVVLPFQVHAEPASIAATPAFWVVEHNGTTLYLLGSVHLLPPEMKW